MVKAMLIAVPGLILPVFLLPLLSMGLAEGQVNLAVLDGKLTLLAIENFGKGIRIVPR